MQFQKYVFACEITSQHTHLIDYRVSKVWMLCRLFSCWSLFLFDFIICHFRKRRSLEHSCLCLHLSNTHMHGWNDFYLFRTLSQQQHLFIIFMSADMLHSVVWGLFSLTYTEIFHTHQKGFSHISDLCVCVCMLKFCPHIHVLQRLNFNKFSGSVTLMLKFAFGGLWFPED